MKDTADIFLLDTAGTSLEDTAFVPTEARISQEVVEVLLVGQPEARVSQEVVETVLSGLPAARVSQLAIEVLIVLPTSATHRLALGIN